MTRLNDLILQNALDLSETIAFEYDVVEDTMCFSDNVSKYIPCVDLNPAYIEGLSIRSKVHPEDAKKYITFIQGMTDDTKLYVEYIRFMNHNGDYPTYQFKAKVTLNNENKPVLIYGTMTLMSEENSDVEIAYSNRDPLTLLDNRETTLSKIKAYYQEIPDDVVAGLMIIDLDDFSAFGKLKGDAASDAVLLELSKVLRKALRGADIIGRYGRDQFIICMKGVRDEKIYCERAVFVQDTLKTLPDSLVDGMKLSCSVGIAIAKKQEEIDLDILLDKANTVLRDVKSSGKASYALFSDTVHWASEYKNIRISGRELDLVKNILDPVMTWAYAVDEKFNIIYVNRALEERLGVGAEGKCYEKIKGYSEPCPDCPIYHMKDRSTITDCNVYSPSLRDVLHMRATRILMRNRSKVYIIANVDEDVKHQIESARVGANRYTDAIMRTNDIIWDINLTTNSCKRIQEDAIMTVLDGHEALYNSFRSYILENVVHQEDREAFIAVTDPDSIHKQLAMGVTNIRREMRLLTRENGYRWYSLTAVVYDAALDEDEYLFISGRDIDRLRTETIEKHAADEKYKAMMKRSAFQTEIAQNNERYEHVNELTGIYVFEYDVPADEYYLCITFDTMFEVTDDMLTDEWSMLEGLTPYEEDEEKYAYFVNLVKTEPDTHSVTLRLMTVYGKPVWFTITVQTLKGLNNTLSRITGVLQNVQAEMEIKAELEFRADFDSVTGLYNSEHFYRLTRERIHKYGDKNYAIIGVDINRFRVINDRFGIEVGNNCLKYMGDSIKRSIPWDGIAGHYQADVFSILLEYEDDQQIFNYMMELDKNFNFTEAQKCGSSLSFGVYKITDRDVPVRLMCDRARFAKKEIKGNALVNYAVYDDKLRLVMREQSEIESEMRLALKNKEFVMYLQPKYDANTETICGAEALVRWHHPTKGVRMPGSFLPLFEDNGFVTNLDEYMWEQAAEYLAKLTKMGVKIPISVNLSRNHIHTEDLIGVLNDIVKRNNIDPKLLELEITENYFLDDVTELYDCMNKLKENGFVLEMDDFGSGYSSLNMLKTAPIDVIKIDRFFLDEIIDTARGRIVVENSIRMSKQLGLTVVAEGVETREQLEFVRDAGCDIVQGYYYSKPVPVEEFEKMLIAEGSLLK